MRWRVVSSIKVLWRASTSGRTHGWRTARSQSTWTWRTILPIISREQAPFRDSYAISSAPADLKIEQTRSLGTDQIPARPIEPPEADQTSLSPQQMAQLKYLHEVLGLVESRRPASGSRPFFVAIDCEAYEHDQTKITEIGISVLNAGHTQSTDSGSDGSPWYAAIQHLHLRPTEYRHLVNRNFIKGCPDDFNHGESTFIALQDVGSILSRIFASPSALHTTADLSIPLPPAAAPDIILVGHALGNDTKYLSSLGCSLTNIIARIDTQRLCGVGKHSQPGLAKLLRALGIEAKGLHNAGNDAAFTMMAMLGVAVREHHEKGCVARALAEAKGSGLVAKKPRNWKEVRARELSGALDHRAIAQDVLTVPRSTPPITPESGPNALAQAFAAWKDGQPGSAATDSKPEHAMSQSAHSGNNAVAHLSTSTAVTAHAPAPHRHRRRRHKLAVRRNSTDR